ncbi:protein-disulfide isomerase [Nitrosopumilus sp. b3]|uniref:DsbA family protein n=1 Tax=Nitrosopumilus sp. b3 TaxID=2109909 RepID=UPI0015F59C5B|nr:thioredoxin domain-containing protein [Nitrosopumilus sp. b3]KAF6246260.1 protein-disulfide isomerase [Nitrosopumilus sp. b3]
MKKTTKVGLTVIPIAILIAMFLILFPFEYSISFTSESEPDKISIETNLDILSSTTSPVIGFPDALVTIIAFNDYQCQNCKLWYENDYPEISKTLIETQKANIVFVDSLPLGSNSILMSEATLCANDQNMYSEYQKLLFTSQEKIDSWGKPTQLKEFAMELGLDLGLFEECLDSRKYENDISSNIEYSKNFGVEKIPLFKIVNFEGNEHILKGGLSKNVFESTVDRFQ